MEKTGVAKEEGTLIATGSFGIDKDAMNRKLAVDAKKLWKHRALLLWKEFGLCGVIVFYCTVSGVIAWFHFAGAKDIHQRIFATCMWSFTGGVTLFFAGILISNMVKSFIQGPLHRISSQWNPDSLSKRLLEKQKNDK